ncbi:MAG: HepT-like ribonuclease domain-containing protein [Tepidiformaceae bacterium]
MARPLAAERRRTARVLREVTGASLEAFVGDWRTQNVIIRELEVIGEAARHLPERFRDAHPDVPWRTMVAMRNILIHAYPDVDLAQVWQAATVAIPRLLVYLEPLLPPEEM